MFPFHRKHGNNASSTKQTGKRRINPKDSADDGEMSDEEYLEYIRNNDNSRHQLTSGAHDRYCHKILREKEDVLLSALHPADNSLPPMSNSYRLGPSNNNIFKCLLPSSSENPNPNKYRESLSMPSSPVENKQHFLSAESISRRKSDTITDTKAASRSASAYASNQAIDDEYILTLKIDNLASDMEDISFYRIGPKQGIYENDYYPFNENLDKYELTESTTDMSQLSDNSSSPVKVYDCSSVHHYEIDIETSIALKRLLIGSENKYFSNQWLRQCFSFCHISASRWRLVQIKSGCCGVIAAVEAYLIKSLLFEPGYCKFKEPLRPSQKEVVDGFIHALAYILWQAGSFKKATVITPSSYDTTKIEGSSYIKDGITDSFIYAEYFDFEQLKDAVAMNMRFFTNSPNHGYLNFLICVILSRSVYRIQEDMDDDAVSLITENGHCSMELVMLLITGQAVSNVFDNDIQIDSCLLKGVKEQSNVGLLSLFEHLNTCEVGNYLKSPKFPVWLVNYTDHFTVLFSSKLEHAQQSLEQPFVLYHYDSMTAFSCENDIKLVIDPLANFSDDQLEKNSTHLQLCIRTKWKNAIVIYAENSELFLV